MKAPTEPPKKRFNRDYSFGWTYFKSIHVVFSIIFCKADLALLFAGITVALVGISEYIANHIGKIPGDMYLALMTKDHHLFWHTMWKAAYMYLAQCGTLGLITFASWLAYIQFRRNLVHALQNKYFARLTYYKLNCIDSEGIDNPDQRITQDVEKVCNDFGIKILPYLFCGPFVVGYYTWDTWRTAGASGVGMSYVFFLIGVIVNFFLMKPLAKWTARAEKQEGNFRYKHMSIRDNAESLALYRAEPFEDTECTRIFNVLIKKQFGLTMWMLPTSFWQQYFDYFGGLMSYAIQFIPIIVLGTYDDKNGAELASIISKNAFVYIYLINSLTRYTDLAISIGQLAGVMQRLSDFIICADEAARRPLGEHNEAFACDVSSPGLSPSAIVQVSEKERNADYYRFENVSYGVPNDPCRILVDNLNLTISHGTRLLVTGPSGCGKSSFLRVLSRIWSVNSGRVTFGIDMEKVMIVPQRAYMPAGALTLRQQFTFPRHLENDKNIGDDVIDTLIQRLDLESVVQACNGLDSPVDFEWHERFTPGELQRISFGRIILHQPELALLDEATNNVSEALEATMYKMLQDLGISYISVGHRTTLQQYHDYLLSLDGRGSYEAIEVETNKL